MNYEPKLFLGGSIASFPTRETHHAPESSRWMRQDTLLSLAGRCIMAIEIDVLNVPAKSITVTT